MAMATSTPSCSCFPLVSASPISKNITSIGKRALNNQRSTFSGALSHWQNRQIPSRFFSVCDNGRSDIPLLKVLPQHGKHDCKSTTLKQFIAPALGVTSLMVSSSAHALTSGLPFDLPEDWVEIFLIIASFSVIYLFVIPLGLYYYLERRWFKRKMAEAILQFGLVFLFFPGMLLLAPFINFRTLPREGAKEPWDEIRPL